MPMGQIERYRGRAICGMTVYDISMGREDVPEELKKAGRRFGFPPDASTGGWIRINPLDGKGVKNDDVTDFKYALVESDSLSLEKQNEAIRILQLQRTWPMY